MRSLLIFESFTFVLNLEDYKNWACLCRKFIFKNCNISPRKTIQYRIWSNSYCSPVWILSKFCVRYCPSKTTEGPLFYTCPPENIYSYLNQYFRIISRDVMTCFVLFSMNEINFAQTLTYLLCQTLKHVNIYISIANVATISKGQNDNAQFIRTPTTQRNRAIFPSLVRICGIAPRSSGFIPIRISTIVPLVSEVPIVMVMRGLWVPAHTGATTYCSVCVTEIVCSSSGC